jgi:8-oxo-dGTP pyrophosphatase MutT (NUDIX family)
MPAAIRRNGHPVSVKGVVFIDARVLLLRNDRDEWELPGGRPEPDETWRQALRREIREEAGIAVRIGALLREWPYEVIPGRHVWIAAYGCQPLSSGMLAVSAEHRELRLFPPHELTDLAMHDGYRVVIEEWGARQRAVVPPVRPST